MTLYQCPLSPLPRSLKDAVPPPTSVPEDTGLGPWRAECPGGAPLPLLPTGRSSRTSCTRSSGRGPPTTWRSATSSRWAETCTSRTCVCRWRPSSGERSIIGTSPPSRCVWRPPCHLPPPGQLGAASGDQGAGATVTVSLRRPKQSLMATATYRVKCKKSFIRQSGGLGLFKVGWDVYVPFYRWGLVVRCFVFKRLKPTRAGLVQEGNTLPRGAEPSCWPRAALARWDSASAAGLGVLPRGVPPSSFSTCSGKSATSSHRLAFCLLSKCFPRSDNKSPRTGCHWLR